MRIEVATTDAEIDRCFPVMIQLRPHIERGSFVPQVRRQMKAGYQLAYIDKSNCRASPWNSSAFVMSSRSDPAGPGGVSGRQDSSERVK
jgi:hypothetical protein